MAKSQASQPVRTIERRKERYPTTTKAKFITCARSKKQDKPGQHHYCERSGLFEVLQTRISNGTGCPNERFS